MRVLISGANSYIGNAVQAWLKSAGHEVEVLDMMGNNWREFDFSSFDSVFHVAGIAHLKEKKRNKDLYYKINAELPLEVADRARESGVKQFIFMSSMSIYAGHGNTNITAQTSYNPKGYYGKSKLQADLTLQEMDSDAFKVVILRPPMVFGLNCKGNYPRLVSLVMKLPVFPNIKNQRSMLHIDNLCDFIKKIIESNSSGVFFPQDSEFYCTTDLAKKIAAENNKKLYITKLFNWLVWCMYPFLPQIKKLFGSLTYDKTLFDLNDFTLE